MNNKIAKALLLELENPDRVKISILNDNMVCILSADNTNDTLDWFLVNSSKIETSLANEGLSWCYVFETIPKEKPMVYLFMGEISEKAIKDELRNSFETLPEDRQIHFEFATFASIDKDAYDNSITPLEEELKQKSSDVFRVIEP